MVRRNICLLVTVFLLCWLAEAAYGQGYRVTGRVVDARDSSTLVNVSLLIVGVPDTAVKLRGITDVDGNFSVSGLLAGSYRLEASYLGYTTLQRRITVVDADLPLGTVKMAPTSALLQSVTITGTETRGKQMGDTTQYNAGAFKTNPDASAEDLVTKMPGVTTDNSGVKVNGEALQQVLVDGKPFFGNDPTLALKNLPAEIIDNVQIFDKQSDQSTFTGFDDGNAQKTMNINTKRGKSEGYFGKLYAGYGSDNRYLAGGNMNLFKGTRRISVMGLFNNINQQNFSQQDLLGVSGGGQGGGAGGGRGGMGRGMFGGGGGNSGNFLVGQAGGIATTNSIGINYTDTWGKKMKVSGSYFFNATDNITRSDLVRTFTDSSINVYTETSTSQTENQNHRLNMRLEYTIDSANSIIFTPSLSLQQNTRSSTTTAANTLRDVLTSNTQNSVGSNLNGYNSNNNLLLEHKLRKQGRTVAVNLSATLNSKTGDGNNLADNRFYTPNYTVGFDQRYDLINSSYTLGTNIIYTEPLTKKTQLMINYNPSVSQNESDKATYDRDLVGGGYNRENTALSSRFNSQYNTQSGGIMYRMGSKGNTFTAGVTAQEAQLTGNQEYPFSYTNKKQFFNLLPNLVYRKNGKDGLNVRISYRASTTAPSVTQLQTLPDISNPLQIRTGNADLRQTYEHNFMARYAKMSPSTGKSLFTYASGNIVNSYIGNAMYLLPVDTTIADAVTGATVSLRRGSQLTRPVNLNGYYVFRAYFAAGAPVKPLKSNFNFSLGMSATRTPGLLNGVLNYTNNYVPSAGFTLGSNISEAVDFTISYTGTYNVINNSTLRQSDNNFYNHTAGAKLNYIFKKKLVFNTNISHNYYTGFSGTGNQNFWLWNSYVAYKFWKNNAMEARVTVFDMLKQNTSISRTVTANYIENEVTQVLQQYVLGQLTYTIRNFKGKMPTESTTPLDGVLPPGVPRHMHGGM